jgi:hypothetical protein
VEDVLIKKHEKTVFGTIIEFGTFPMRGGIANLSSMTLIKGPKIVEGS